jgi:hypothetical protein
MEAPGLRKSMRLRAAVAVNALALVGIVAAAIYFNQHYGVINLVVGYDLADFLVDAGWKLISGQVPFVDFHVYAAPVVALQALFMLVAGNTAMSLVLHASVFNALFGVIVYAVLRRLDLGPLAATVYGLASVVTFYPPLGVPQPNQHSYVSAVLAIFLQVVALAPARRTALLYAGAGLAAAIAFLCKPVPAVYFLPLYVFLWLMLPRERLLPAAAGGAAGLALAAVGFAGPPLAAGATLADIAYYTLMLPLGIGATRKVFELRLLDNVHNFNLAGAVISLAGVLVAPFLLIRRDVAGRWRFAGAVPYAIALTCIAVAIHLASTSQIAPWLNVGPVFLALGALHAAMRTMAPPEDVHSRTAAGFLAALLLVTTVLDGYRFNRTANKERGYQGTDRILEEVQVGDILGNEPAFAGERFFTMADKTVVVSRSDVRARAELRRDILATMRASPENPILLGGLSTIYYAFAGKPSPLPIITLRPGYSSPLAGTPQFARLRALTGANLRKFQIRYALISSVALQRADVAALLPSVACGLDARQGFSVLRFCQPQSDATLDLVMLASGLADGSTL